jgi:hypothetical protein
MRRHSPDDFGNGADPLAHFDAVFWQMAWPEPTQNLEHLKYKNANGEDSHSRIISDRLLF